MLEVTAGGQNLSDDDLMMVHDISRGEIRNSSLGNLFNSYINGKLPHAVGTLNSVQLKGNNRFDASPALTFDPRTRVLNVDGRVVADALTVTGKTDFEGFVARKTLKP